MDRPMSMSIKDYLIRKLAVKMMVSEKVIETVINHQFQSATTAMYTSQSVELSGFGKFFFNTKKAQKKMEKLLSKKALFERQAVDEQLSEQRRASAFNKLMNTLEQIETLKPKLLVHEPVSDI
jgi:nucleoid DNA-binding protein